MTIMNKNNPFNIAFGKEPTFVISRDTELQEIYDSFSSVNPDSDVYIITGVRGSGKTVAMTEVSNHYKKMDDWICVDLNPENDMLEQLAAKLYDEGKMKKHFLSAEFNFSFQGFGFSIKGKEPVSNISTLLKHEFEYLQRKGVNVLITVDEIVSNGYVKVFVHEFQTFLREDYNVRLLMTGLYQNVSLLQKQKSLTFLCRAPKVYLRELNSRAISNAYKNFFKISKKESIDLAKLTSGYAFGYQLLGNILYGLDKTVADEMVLEKYDEMLQERVYDIIYSELSPREKDILRCALVDPSNEYISSILDMSSNQLSNYKKVLYLKGITTNNRNGIVYALPRFNEFVNFVVNYEE